MGRGPYVVEPWPVANRGVAYSLDTFAGQTVGVTQVGERILGYFDYGAARVEPIDYPFGSKVLPMSPE